MSGAQNVISGAFSGILGGNYNAIASCYSIIGGGCNNTVCNSIARSGIVGGHFNAATCNDAFIVGSCITTNRACTTFVNNLSIIDIPTSSAGLPSKSVWSNAGILTIVP
jgi:hypothetical protein